MNLFEQYGIKEVADVTLYAITLDKYDNEVYIPVIYFDTLKVSTVEQSAGQASARGGLGNPNLIIWDYGKEITVNLQDALYTPASQSLVWGGRFNLGKFKIFGAWNPCIFYEWNPKLLCSLPLSDTDTNIIWPKDLSERKVQGFIPLEVEYYYQKIDKSGPFFMKDFIIEEEKQADCAEVIIDSYENIQVEELFKSNDNRIPFIRYIWKNAILKLVVLDGSKTLAYSKPIDICFEESKYHNTEGELCFIKNSRKEYSIDFYLNFNQYYSIEWQQKKEIQIERKLGTFYIVEDRNYFNFSKNNIIYPIDYGIKNATKLDRMEEVVASRDFVINTEINFDMYNKSQLKKYDNSNLKFYLNPVTMKPFEQNCTDFTRANGTVIEGPFALVKKGTIYYKWTRDINTDMSLGKQIIVDALHYPGNFKLVGETRSRRRDDGRDERLQFEIPLCKLSSNTNLQLAAEGEPTVYNFSLKVLRPENGIMMKLTQYKVKKDIITNIAGEKYCSNSTSVVLQQKIPTYDNCCPTSQEIEEAMNPGTVSLQEIGMMDINDVDLIDIYNENRQAIISVLVDAGMNNSDIDTLLPPYDVNKPLETAFFSTAARQWLVNQWVQIPKLVDINILSPIENTVYTTPNDFAIPYNNTPPDLLLPTSDQEAEQWLIEINNNPEMGRNKLIVELIYDIVPPTYLTTDLATNFNIDFINGSDGE